MIIQVATCRIGTSGRPAKDLVEPEKIWVVDATDGEFYCIRDVNLPIVPGQLLNIVLYKRGGRGCRALHTIKQ